MYYYEISWSWNDSYHPVIFYHERYFKEEELKHIVDRVIRLAFGELLDQENKLDLKDRNYIGFSRLEEVFDIIFKYLKDHGFNHLSISNKIDYFGMYIIESESDDIKRLNEICGDDLVYKLIEHNKEVKNLFWKEKVERKRRY